MEKRLARVLGKLGNVTFGKESSRGEMKQIRHSRLTYGQWGPRNESMYVLLNMGDVIPASYVTLPEGTLPETNIFAEHGLLEDDSASFWGKKAYVQGLYLSVTAI